MNIEIHAPSTRLLVVSVALALLAVICYMTLTPNIAFGIAILAYLVLGLAVMLK
jgi:hypothetical protein